jgi:hypothetical protein
MSGPATTSPANPFVDRVIPLLKEYTEKLNGIKMEANKLRRPTSTGVSLDHRVWNDLQTKLQALTPPAKSLAQHVSQKLEHGALDEVDRLELWLRLAEFEHALLAAEKVLLAARNTPP